MQPTKLFFIRIIWRVPFKWGHLKKAVNQLFIYKIYWFAILYIYCFNNIPSHTSPYVPSPPPPKNLRELEVSPTRLRFFQQLVLHCRSVRVTPLYSDSLLVKIKLYKIFKNHKNFNKM